MNHDELLAKIDKILLVSCDQTVDLLEKTVPCGECFVCQALDALRAVVELHKPIDNPNFPDSDKWCWQCAEGRGYANYPCPTIQAIEKELK